MADLVTVQTMVDRMRLLGDYLTVDGDYTGDAPRAPSSGTLIGWLDWAHRRVWNQYAETDEDFALTRTVLSASAGSGTIALPSDFLRLRAVEASPALQSTGWVPLRRATVDDDRWATDGTSTGNAMGSWGHPQAYRTFGDGYGSNTLELLPYPSSPFSVRASYTPQPLPLTDPSQTIDGVNGYDECVVLRALLYSRAREGLDSREFSSMLADALADMRRAIRRRDRASPRRLRDRRSSGGRGGGGGRW